MFSASISIRSTMKSHHVRGIVSHGAPLCMPCVFQALLDVPPLERAEDGTCHSDLMGCNRKSMGKYENCYFKPSSGKMLNIDQNSNGSCPHVKTSGHLSIDMMNGYQRHLRLPGVWSTHSRCVPNFVPSKLSSERTQKWPTFRNPWPCFPCPNQAFWRI